MNNSLGSYVLVLSSAFATSCSVASANEREQQPSPGSARPPWQADFSLAVVPPAEPSSPPTKDEWKATSPAADARVTEPSCLVKRIREWVRVECTSVTAIERVSGPYNEVSFGCFRTNPVDDFACDQAWVVFPLRLGERRVFESFRPTRWSSAADSLISGQFLEGDKTPLVSVQGIRGGF